MCAKKNPLGSNFIKPKGTTHFGGKEINDKFMNYLINENKEGKALPEGFFEIGRYKDITYKINRDGTVTGKDGKIIKPSCKNERLYITMRTDNGKVITKPILSILEKIYGPYYRGYTKKQEEPNKYELRPKDGNYLNLNRNNLEYVDKLEGTKKGLILTLINRGIDFDIIEKGLSVDENYLLKIAREVRQGDPEITKLKEKYKINFRNEMYPVYKLLIDSNGDSTDDEINKKTGFENKDIDFVRKKLTKIGIIKNNKK